MRQIIASRPARKLTLLLLAIALSTGGMFYATNSDARVYKQYDPSAMEPALGEESNIIYSIPTGAQSGLMPGTTVSNLPSGCATKYTSSLTYYDCSNVYFREYFRGSKVVYMVIDKP